VFHAIIHFGHDAVSGLFRSMPKAVLMYHNYTKKNAKHESNEVIDLLHLLIQHHPRHVLRLLSLSAEYVLPHTCREKNRKISETEKNNHKSVLSILLSKVKSSLTPLWVHLPRQHSFQSSDNMATTPTEPYSCAVRQNLVVYGNHVFSRVFRCLGFQKCYVIVSTSCYGYNFTYLLTYSFSM